MVKECTKCGEEKALTEFHKDKNGKYGVYSSCKECKREYRQQPEVKKHNSKYQREYYQRPSVKEHTREYQRERFQNPEMKERHREYMRKYLQRPGMRERRRELTRELMKDPVRIERQRKRENEYYRLRKEMGLVSNRRIEVDRKNAIRNSEPWSDAEVKFLMSSNLPLVDIALELGRTYGSVQVKRSRIRKKLGMAINMQDVA